MYDRVYPTGKGIRKVNFAEYKREIGTATNELRETIDVAHQRFNERLEKATRAFHEEPGEKGIEYKRVESRDAAEYRS
jgi:hypothetical protein